MNSDDIAYLFGPVEFTDELSAKMDYIGISHERLYFTLFNDADVHLFYKGCTYAGNDAVDRLLVRKMGDAGKSSIWKKELR